MNNIQKEIHWVSASLSPTPHNKIWLSSGRVPPCNYYKNTGFISFSSWVDISRNREGVR